MAEPKQGNKQVQAPEELVGLAKEIAAIDMTSKNAIVPIGVRLEKSWTTLRVAGADKIILEILKNCLSALQYLYQDKFKDAQAAWSVIGQAIQATENRLSGSTESDAELLPAGKQLQSLLETNSSSPSKDTASKPKPATPPAAAPELDTLSAMEDIAAKLMGIDPSDNNEITALQGELVRLSGASDLAAGALHNVKAALAKIEFILAGRSENSEAEFDQVASLLGLAAQAQEKPAGKPAAATTAPAPAAAKTEPTAAPAKTVIEFPTPAIMAEDTDEELLKEYIIESLDHISNAEGSLLELESNPESKEPIDVVFRAYHTIKGTSGFLGFDRIQKLAHLAENMLDRAREGQIKIMGGYADLCLRSCDSLRTMLEGLRGIKPGMPLKIPDDLTDLLEILSNPEQAGYSEQASETAPLRVGDILVAREHTSRQEIEELEKTKGSQKLGQAAIEEGVVDTAQVVEAIRTQKQLEQGQGIVAENTVRVGTNRLDSLINMVGELVIAQSMVAQDPSVVDTVNSRLQRNVSHAGKIIRELQDLTMSLRMVPLKSVFQKMNRLVRDLARKSGKQVQFITDGEDTEIDRNMVEGLNDPLVHMMRNSVDHGIEMADKRQAAGKNPTGTVLLRAYHAAGNVVIELQDDGNGLNRDRIYAKAVEKGLIENGRDLSDTEVFSMIFAPGFSTAEKITDVSGRGVGMDVVKRNIEKMRGRVEVSSTAGKGTTFHVRLPLTMAITDAMILRVGQSRYLLPTISIEQSFQPKTDAIFTVTGRGEMVMLRGELLPMFRLHEMFNITDAVQEPHEGLLIVIEGDGKRCALMVDELLGQQQVVIKSLGRGMAAIPGVSGGAILGDGRVGLILDALGLLQLAEGRTEDVEVAVV